MPNMFGGDQLDETYAPWANEKIPVQSVEKIPVRPVRREANTNPPAVGPRPPAPPPPRARCDHRFVHQSVVTWPADRRLPGTDARPRVYADLYFCERCLVRRFSAGQEMGTTYEPVSLNAVEYPAKPQEAV